MTQARNRVVAACTLALAAAAAVPLAGFAAAETTASTAAHATDSTRAATTYAVDPVHSNIVFKIRHSGVSNFYGRFNTMSGTIDYDKNNIENTSVDFTVDVGSVDTNNAKRDNHLKGADFFNARQYPEATFTTTSVSKNADGNHTLTGDLTFHGTTRQVTAELVDIDTGMARDKQVLGFEARFDINRSDFGITKWVDAENPEESPLGNNVEIIVAIEAVEN